MVSIQLPFCSLDAPPSLHRGATSIARSSGSWPASSIGSATPCTEGDQVPYRHQDDSTDERSENGDTIDIDITNTFQYDDLSQQPGTGERCNDSADDAKREPPANDGFCDDANDSRD